MQLTIQSRFAALAHRRLLIATLMCMITLTACTPVQPPAPAPPATTVTPTPIDVTGPPAGVLALPGQRPLQLVLDEQFVYWVGPPDERFLYRAPLHAQVQPAEIEVLAESRYPQGVLDQFSLVQDGDWLTFFDSASPAISDQWALRRIHLVTRIKSTLVESMADKLLYSFVTSEHRVAWFMLDHNRNRACEDEAVLATINLTTGQQIALDRTCFQTGRYWRPLAIRNDILIADLLADNGDNASVGKIVRFNLATSQPVTDTVISDLLDESPVNVFPHSLGDWVVWNRGQATFGEPMLFHLPTQQIELLPIAEATAPCQYLQITERWIAGRDCANPSSLLLYDPVQRQVVRLQTNDDLAGAVVASAGNVVAVARAVELDTANPDSVIEWYEVK